MTIAFLLLAIGGPVVIAWAVYLTIRAVRKSLEQSIERAEYAMNEAICTEQRNRQLAANRSGPRFDDAFVHTSDHTSDHRAA